jgi:hypothetical protein
MGFSHFRRLWAGTSENEDAKETEEDARCAGGHLCLCFPLCCCTFFRVPWGTKEAYDELHI